MFYPKNRPYFFASTVVGMFAFILYAPVLLLTMMNISDHMIFETSDIHFYVEDIGDEDLIDHIEMSLNDLNIEKIVTFEIRNIETFKKLSIFFELKTNKRLEIDHFIAKLKDNASLSFSSENYRSFLSKGYIKYDFLIISQLFCLFLFSYFYLSVMKPKSVMIADESFRQYVLLKVIAISFGTVLLVQAFSFLLNTIGVHFTELEVINKETLELNWMFYLSILLLAPIIEELVFRGIIYKNFLFQNLALKGAILTSILFASIHQLQIWQLDMSVKISHFLIMFMISLVFCFLYKKTTQLWVPIFAHAFYNSYTMLLDFWSKLLD